MAVARTVDLNAALAGSGMLGDGVPARPALAHPRALVVTNDGDSDDDDETRLRHRVLLAGPHRHRARRRQPFDVGRQGVVYSFDAAGYQVATPITIAPVADTGFVDSKGDDDRLLPQPAVRGGHQQRAPLRHGGV